MPEFSFITGHMQSSSTATSKAFKSETEEFGDFKIRHLIILHVWTSIFADV